jgi:hypothetical protein
VFTGDDFDFMSICCILATLLRFVFWPISIWIGHGDASSEQLGEEIVE